MIKMKTIRQNDLLKLMLKGGVQIKYGVDIWVVVNDVLVGTITESTFDMLCDEGIILYNTRTNMYDLVIEGRGN